MYRNLHNALPALLQELLSEGYALDTRNGEAVELTGHVVALSRPWERIQVWPHRHANVFAQVAETLWMLAGRNDITWLQHYLPRASQFSDDGKTWRGAYGPRLRQWTSFAASGSYTVTDQVMEAYRLLREEPGTRRVVLSLWDPARDLGAASLDIPCNDTLQFLQRDNRLDLHVFVRSNDVWWGYSGINAFAWSVLQEMMASWLGLNAGRMVTFAGSWHLYQIHWDRARKVIAAAASSEATIPPLSVYSDPWVGRTSPRWDSPASSTERVLEQFFRLEARMREGGDITGSLATIHNSFVRGSAVLLNVYNAAQQGRPERVARQYLEELPERSDLRLAAEEWLGRYYIQEEKEPTSDNPA